jgi:hypothetical protein
MSQTEGSAFRTRDHERSPPCMLRQDLPPSASTSPRIRSAPMPPAVGRQTPPHELRSRPRQRARHADRQPSSFPALPRAKRRWQTSRSPGEIKPITLLAHSGRLNVWLRPGGFHHGPSARRSSKGRIHDCNAWQSNLHSVTCKGSPYTHS